MFCFIMQRPGANLRQTSEASYMHIIQPLKTFKHKIPAELGGNLVPGPQEAYSLVLKTHIKFLNWILNMN